MFCVVGHTCIDSLSEVDSYPDEDDDIRWVILQFYSKLLIR